MLNSAVERRLELSNPVIVIVGPTASGKTDVAQEIACRVNGEVISADSMQIYKGMDIGTGKLPESERLVPHWGFDIRRYRSTRKAQRACGWHGVLCAGRD